MLRIQHQKYRRGPFCINAKPQRNLPESVPEASNADLSEKMEAVVEPINPLDEPRFIGEAFRTYIIFESGDEMLA